MFILLVHNHYKSTHFGGEDLVFRQEVGMLRRRLGEDRVFTYEVHNDRTSLPSIILGLFFPIIHSIRIRNLVVRHKIDVVHVHNDFPILSLWFMRILRGVRCVRVQTLHNYRQWCINGIFYLAGKGVCEACISSKNRFLGVMNGCYRQSRLQSLLVYLAQSVYRFFRLPNEIDQYFCLSEHQRQKLISLGVHENRIQLKPNSVNPPRNVDSSTKEFDFLYVGRLEESKGIFRVLDALNADMLGKIHVVGHSENMDELKTQYPGVVFHGKKNNIEVLGLMSKARFVLQPSLCYETFGLTLIESMSLGTPVMGFPIGTRLDFIRDGENGFLMNEKTIQSDMIRALEFENYESLRINAIRFAEEFKEESIVERQLKSYQDLIEKRKIKNIS